MKWVKDITGMNYFWLISNCILFFCFRLSLLVYLSFVVVLLLPCSLLYTFNFCYNMCPQFCSVSSFFLVLYFYCSHDIFLFSFYFSVFSILIFFTVEGDALLCRRNLPFKSDQQYICWDRSYHFQYVHLLSFELLFVLAWVFFNKICLQFSTQNSSNDFIG